MNFLLDHADALVGLPPTLPRYKIPQPIIHHGPMKFHNINVDEGNIGVLNLGDIERLDVAMNIINDTGKRELTDALKEFTQAVINVQEVDKELKKELIEQIAFLSTQATLSKEMQKPSVVKSVIKTIKEILTNFNCHT